MGLIVRIATLLLALVVLLVSGSEVWGDSTSRPNILFILADDLGWKDVGYHGSEIETPHIDELARDGVVLNQHYVTPVCSSTRAALLSGRYPSRFGCVGPTNRWVFPPGTVTLASALSAQGYDTCITGKWHLGSLPQWGPLKFGFQRSYGCLAGGIDQYLHLYKKGPFVRTWHRDDKLFDEAGHSTDLFAQQAIRWIETKRDRPFFIYVPFTAVHIPLQESDEWLSRYEGTIKEKSRRYFAACATHMDDVIGKILAAVDRTGQRDDTLVIFTSDNGGQRHWRARRRYPGEYFDCPVLADNGPLRGWKTEVYEGGVRVPTVVSWSGRLKPVTVQQPVNMVDWMPTLCALAGYVADTDPKWDGQDIWPHLTGKATQAEVRSFYWKTTDQTAVRHGDWKMIVPLRKERRAVELFDLASDPYEQQDLSAGYPKKVEQLGELLAQFQELDNSERIPFAPKVK